MRIIPTSIGIIGTCVSIDIFDINKNSEIIRSKKPVRATSILTLDSRLTSSIEITHQSSWFEEMLKCVFDGRIKECIKKQRGEYCIIDLVEERFKLFKVDNKDIFLNSSYCQQANIFEKLNDLGHSVTELDHYELQKEYIELKIKEFARYLCTVYRQDKIIINEIYLVDNYTDGKTNYHFLGDWEQYIIKKSNDLFGYMYGILKKNLPHARVINVTNDNMGDAYHYHKCSPSHFVPKTYMDIFSKVVKIVCEDYSKQRKIDLIPWDSKNTVESCYSKGMLKSIGLADEWIPWFIDIGRRINFEGKKVLQIGNGAIPKEVTRNLKCKKWIVLSMDSRSEYDFKEKYISPEVILPTQNYITYNGTIDDLTFDFCDMFDIVISRGEIEKVKDLSNYFDNIYKILDGGGIYFERAGRIWSSNEGSKWKISSKHNYNYPKDMPYFPHLLCTEEEILKYLDDKYQWNFLTMEKEDNLSYADKMNIAKKIVNGDGTLNKRFYEEYRESLCNTLFHIKMIKPIFKYEMNHTYLEQLEERYYPYKVFDYKSLEIYCEK